MNLINRVPCTLCRPALIVAGLVFLISGAVAADPVRVPVESLPKHHVPVQEVIADVRPAKSDADQAVSPTMQDLVHDFVMASIRRDALESGKDNEALGIAIEQRHEALVALAFHRPANLLDLAAKLMAITEYAEDVERWANRATAEDAARLAGEVAK